VLNHIQLTNREQVSLIDMPNTIRLADISLKMGYESPNRKTRMALSAGYTKALGNPQIRLSLPVAVDEAGAVSYRHLSESAGKLYDHSRVSFSINNKVTKNFDAVAIASSFGPTTSSILNNYFIGAAGKWSY